MYIVIAGGGKVGEYLASVLLQSGNDVAVIDKDLTTANRLSVVLEGRYLVIHGDGCDSKYQEDAGIRRADVFVATTGQDDNNLVSCEIAHLIEEETLLGSVSVASSLTHGDVLLSEVVVPRMRHHSNEAGVLASSIPMPDNSLIAAVSTKDDVEVVSEETVLFPGDKAVVVADASVLDEVRALFKGL